MNKKIVIFGGGTISHISSHLAISAPAYGTTAKWLAELSRELLPKFDVDLRLTTMAGGPKTRNTYEDLEREIDEVINDPTVKVVIMTTAIVDYEPQPKAENPKSLERPHLESLVLQLSRTKKLIGKIRSRRKDIFLVGFKNTAGLSEEEQYIEGLKLLKKNSCNLVLANDVVSRLNMVITPEESKYHVSVQREEVLRGLLTMIGHRTHLTFTRSTVVDGVPISWESAEIPESLRTVVNYCVENNAYKPLNGVTTGHFAFKVNDNTFITSIRRTNFNDIKKNGMVRIVTDGPDTVLAYGAKPSVGGQSQRIIFRDHAGLDCIVHFHCPKKENSKVPTVSQYEFECGSHECGQNTSNGLAKFGDIYAVYLDNHGPNIVFNHAVDPLTVISFINENFDLSKKTGGYVTLLRNGSAGLPVSTLDVIKDLK